MAVIVSWHNLEESVTIPEPPGGPIYVEVDDVTIDKTPDGDINVHIKYKPAIERWS